MYLCLLCNCTYKDMHTHNQPHTFDITHRIVKGLSQYSKLLKTIWQSSRRKLSKLIHFFGFSLITMIVVFLFFFFPLSALQRENLTPFDSPISEPKLQNSTLPCPVSFEIFPLLGSPGSKHSTPFLGAADKKICSEGQRWLTLSGEKQRISWVSQ